MFGHQFGTKKRLVDAGASYHTDSEMAAVRTKAPRRADSDTAVEGDARPETGSRRAGGMVLVFDPILKIILGVEGIRRKVPPVLYQVEGNRVLGCQQDQDA